MLKKEPRLGCGAAIISNGKILLLRRLHDPEAGCWGLPGSKADWLETVEQAVIREIYEELGLKLEDIRLLCVVDQIDLVRHEHWAAPVYLATTFRGDPIINEPEKHSAFGWFPFSSPPKPVTIATVTAIAALNDPRGSIV